VNNRGAASLCIAIATKGNVDIAPCLKALSQDIEDIALSITIHIAHDQDLELEIIQQLFPTCSLNSNTQTDTSLQIITTRCPDLTSILRLWGIALANTTEQYAAVIDASCPPSTGWLSIVAENVQKDIPVFYGSVEPGWNLNNVNIIGYIIEYSQFKSPIQCNNEYPGNNIIFKTSLLESKEELINDGFFKTFMLWKLEHEHNEKPQYFDNMAVFYFKTFQFLHYMKRRRDHGRCFGALRLKQEHQPPRWACIAFTPFLFLLRTARIYKWIKQKPELVKAYFRYISTIISSELAWSYGEFLGYSFGDNGACQHLD
jgi:hypothetical protein